MPKRLWCDRICSWPYENVHTSARAKMRTAEFDCLSCLQVTRENRLWNETLWEEMDVASLLIREAENRVLRSCCNNEWIEEDRLQRNVLSPPGKGRRERERERERETKVHQVHNGRRRSGQQVRDGKRKQKNKLQSQFTEFRHTLISRKLTFQQTTTNYKINYTFLITQLKD